MLVASAVQRGDDVIIAPAAVQRDVITTGVVSGGGGARPRYHQAGGGDEQMVGGRSRLFPRGHRLRRVQGGKYVVASANTRSVVTLLYDLAYANRLSCPAVVRV